MKKFLALLMAMSMVLAMVACSNTSGGNTGSGNTSGDDTNTSGDTGSTGGAELTFGTGGDQGTYYAFGNVLAQRISSDTDTGVTAVVSNGSQDNIENMDMGNYQLGFVQSDVMSYAYEGTNLFDGMAVNNFSTVAAL